MTDVNALAQKMIEAIYVMRCPFSGVVRYIGKSNDIAKRLTDHIKVARSGAAYRCSRWIRGLLSSGRSPEIKVLFLVPPQMPWQVAERFFIASARHFGLPITNLTTGGEGVIFLTEAHLLKAKAARKAGFTAEVRANISAFQKEYRSRPEVRRQMSLCMKMVHANPDHKKSVIAKSKLSNGMEDVKEKISKASKALWDNPAFRESQIKKMRDAHSPESEVRRRESIKAAHARPDVKARHSAAIRLTYDIRHFVYPFYESTPDKAIEFVNYVVANLRGDENGKP